MSYQAILLDRDGVLNEHGGRYVITPDDFVMVPGAAAAVARLNAAGLPVAVITNQSAIGRGMLTRTGLDQIHQRLHLELAAAGARLDGLFYCPHRPDEQCDCRKPRPGLIRQAATALGFDPARALVIGDKLSDIAAAGRAGGDGILLRTGQGLEQLAKLAEAEHEPLAVLADLPAAVDWLLG